MDDFWKTELDKLAKYLIDTFGEDKMIDGESCVDMAIRLLDNEYKADDDE